MLKPQEKIMVWGTPHVDWIQLEGQAFETSHQFYNRFNGTSPAEAAKGTGSQAGGSVLLSHLLQRLIGASKENISCFPSNELDTDSKPPSSLLDKMPDKLSYKPNSHGPFQAGCTHKWTQWKRYRNTDGTAAYRLTRWTDLSLLTITDATKNYFLLEPTHCAEHYGLYLIDDRGWKNSQTDLFKEVDLPHLKNPDAKIYLKLATERPFDTPIIKQILCSDIKLAKNTTLILTITELRSLSTNVGISGSLSWEQMFDDIADAVRALLDAQVKNPWSEVIVTVGFCGAVILKLDPETPQTVIKSRTLVYDRLRQEGDYENEFHGQTLGYHTCLMAVLGATYIASGESETFTAQAVCKGLCMVRELHKGGYELRPNHNDRLFFPLDRLETAFFRSPMPWDSRVEAIHHETDSASDRLYAKYLQQLFGDHDYSTFRHFTRTERIGDDNILRLLDDSKDEVADTITQKISNREKLFKIAKKIVEHGPDEYDFNAPVCAMGRWSSADRKEIEGIRSVHNAIHEYITNSNENRPISIGVFGPPGSGKSFAVKEIGRSHGLKDNEIRTFNLSQYETPTELARAFHEIRDLNLKGVKNPLIFWDEFDSKCGDDILGWLRHFLVPMQDGEFSEAGVLHSIGRAIFVFAGGTCFSYKKFVDKEAELSIKKPDFISRLRAYVDVKGVNGEPNFIEDSAYVIRRAFLLRSFLMQSDLINESDRGNASKYIQLDDAVLNALLRTSKYTHGARSMEAVVRLSTLSGRAKFELSSLPPPHLLGMHVEEQNFLDYTQRQCKRRIRIGIIHSKTRAEHQDKQARNIIIQQLYDYLRQSPTEKRDPPETAEDFLEHLAEIIIADPNQKRGMTMLFSLSLRKEGKEVLDVMTNFASSVALANAQPSDSPRKNLYAIRPRMIVVTSHEDRFETKGDTTKGRSHRQVDFWRDGGAEVIRLVADAQTIKPRSDSIEEDPEEIQQFIYKNSDIQLYLPFGVGRP